MIVVRESRIEREGEGERGERPLDRSSRSSPSKGRSEEGTGRDEWWWAGWSINRTYLGEIYIGGRLRSLSKSRNDRRGLGRMRGAGARQRTRLLHHSRSRKSREGGWEYERRQGVCVDGRGFARKPQSRYRRIAKRRFIFLRAFACIRFSLGSLCLKQLGRLLP